jgi:hypothetical protein
MPVNPDKVLMVKLPRELAEALRQHADGWSRAFQKGIRCPAPDADGTVEYPLHSIIAILLRRDQAHRRRSNRPRRRAGVQYQG